MSILNATPQQLRRAADLQERIQGLQAELARLLGEQTTPSAPAPQAQSNKRQISASGKAAIAAAARARWAKFRASKGPTAAQKPAQHKMSPAARRKLAEVARARWAKVRAQGKSRL